MDLHPRLIRSVPDALGLYFRAGLNDHGPLLERMQTGDSPFSGVVVSGARIQRHSELIEVARNRGVEAVLDPHSFELSTLVGFGRSSFAGLPWKGEEQHSPSGLRRGAGALLAAEVAAFAAEHRFGAVLAPTHFVEDAESEWLAVDEKLTLELRRQLDANGAVDTRIYYPLMIARKSLGNAAYREDLVQRLSRLPIDAVWLRVHPFGATAGGVALRSYVDGALDLQRIGVPVVGEKTGTAGLALLAFGAVGGIESGVTNGERFDAKALQRPQKPGDGFLPPPRVYVGTLGVFMTRSQAEALFTARGTKAFFACRDASCCANGFRSMLEDPRRHFLKTRSREVGRLGGAAPALRASLYLEEILRPASDLVLKAARAGTDFNFEAARKRLDQWRETLGAMHQAGLGRTSVEVPKGRRVRVVGKSGL